MLELWCWRHPRADGAAGRCIGRTDLALDARRAKHLAHRMRNCARRHSLPQVVHVSPLRRCRDVARWLRRWGWCVVVDERLRELDFGAWDGRRWSDIPHAEVLAWQHALMQHAPGGGETLAALGARARSFAAVHSGVLLVVSHAGWMNALRCLATPEARVDASTWPAAPAHASLLRLNLNPNPGPA